MFVCENADWPGLSLEIDDRFGVWRTRNDKTKTLKMFYAFYFSLGRTDRRGLRDSDVAQLSVSSTSALQAVERASSQYILFPFIGLHQLRESFEVHE